MSDQDTFSLALLDPQLPCPPGLCSANGADPASRFAVYRNNVQGSLINALADSYPVVHALVGDEFFRAMAAAHVRQCPPTSPILKDYGRDFDVFIRGFAPAASVPYLADVARLERLRIDAYHAADAASLSPERIGQHLANPDALGSLRVGLHPSIAVLESPFAMLSIWLAHHGEGELEQIDPDQGEVVLVLRSQWQVELFRIDSGSRAFIQRLLEGLTLEAAMLHAHDISPAFDPARTLGLLIRHGAIVQLQAAS
ncbi:HvfC/BufC N-terminal domain-containing protein [Pseudomonas vanderleydeniana]|uniref:DNA-binding domain-containing protein n=1 Tax=Pseudomonas vanderleydeniana TaxID=2745495 RepID=A0A9E6PMY1_9PSED|nr:DNA-binding domain-containing protein [Pseudomonas vanderleydeniana]QXI29799.1 putative DNA-binding domain-containing protein [Pseudomonas vanderleydeniana]